MIDSVLKVYVCGAQRSKWAAEIALKLGFGTIYTAEGVTGEWGRETTLVVEHAFDHDGRKWSVYDDLFPIIREYLKDQSQDVGYVTCLTPDGLFRGYLLDPADTQDDGDWFLLAGQLIVGYPYQA